MAKPGWAIGGVLSLLGFVAATDAAAHPHQFIDVTAQLVVDEAGRLTAIRAQWRLDESFSLSLAAGLGFDPDGPLTPAQQKQIDPEFAVYYASASWLTHVTRNGETLALGPPRDRTYRLHDGVISLDWELPLAAPAALRAAPLRLQFYDPSFFGWVQVVETPTFIGAPLKGGMRCEIAHERFEADAEAKAELARLFLIPIDATPEDPTVGRKFADNIEARCGHGSGES